MVFSLVYSSTTNHDWSQDELVALLEWSRGWNSDHGVTGLLLYRDCAFMQFLEGDEPTVRGLFANITVDRRHQDVDLMWSNDTEHRRFADWTMGYRELAEQPVAEPGYNRLLNAAMEPDEDEHVETLDDFLTMFRPY
ncbi:MAG: BLUF domain-containing protein [Janthinobacterium lividum]